MTSPGHTGLWKPRVVEDKISLHAGLGQGPGFSAGQVLWFSAAGSDQLRGTPLRCLARSADPEPAPGSHSERCLKYDLKSTWSLVKSFCASSDFLNRFIQLLKMEDQKTAEYKRELVHILCFLCFLV